MNDSSEAEELIWDQYAKLNILRNKIAHKLEPDNIETLTKEFNKSVILPYPEEMNK